MRSSDDKRLVFDLVPDRALADGVDDDNDVRRDTTNMTPVGTVITVILLLMTSFPEARTEIVFHRRDHRDQGSYSPGQPVYHIRNYVDAMVRRESRVVTRSYF